MIIDIIVEGINSIDVDVELVDIDIDVLIDPMPDIEIQAFEYPIEVELLNVRVAELAQIATEAASSANNSSQTASQAIEVANEAKSLIQEHEASANHPSEDQMTAWDGKESGGAAIAVKNELLNQVPSEGSTLKKLYDFILTLFPNSGNMFSGSIDLSNVDKHYNDYSQVGVLTITIANGSIVGGSAEVTITTNGSAITVTGANNYNPDSPIDYTNGKINHFLFTKFEHGVYFLVKQLN